MMFRQQSQDQQRNEKFSKKRPIYSNPQDQPRQQDQCSNPNPAPETESVQTVSVQTKELKPITESEKISVNRRQSLETQPKNHGNPRRI